MMNVWKNIPFKDTHMGNRKVADEPFLQIMQIALKPGQAVPEHKANSNVHLLILKGQITLQLEQDKKMLSEGDLLPVAFRTLMNIKNSGEEDATFLVLKAPHPSEMTA